MTVQWRRHPGLQDSAGGGQRIKKDGRASGRVTPWDPLAFVSVLLKIDVLLGSSLEDRVVPLHLFRDVTEDFAEEPKTYWLLEAPLPFIFGPRWPEEHRVSSIQCADNSCLQDEGMSRQIC